MRHREAPGHRRGTRRLLAERRCRMLRRSPRRGSGSAHASQRSGLAAAHSRWVGRRRMRHQGRPDRPGSGQLVRQARQVRRSQRRRSLRRQHRSQRRLAGHVHRRWAAEGRRSRR
jgi:hypothetical protein